MEIRIYFEGNRTLRSGFKKFFDVLERSGRDRGSTVEFIAAKNGLSDYRKASRSHPQAWNILLKDSEQQWSSHSAMCDTHGIHQSLANNVFWMVELMESWFLADPQALSEYYRRDFSVNAIGNTEDVERIPKAEVLRRLDKVGYHKVSHAPHLLERLNPERVQQRAQHCRLLFEAVRTRLA
jgi:hypothetical protein